MDKLIITKEQEAEAIARVWNMGCESLEPNLYYELENVLHAMINYRNISYECIAKYQIILSGKSNHSSDCRTSGSPAQITAPCNCDFAEVKENK